MKRSGISLAKLRGHYGAKRLAAEGNYTALEFRHAGFTAREVHDGGFGPIELRKAGFSNTDLRNIGYSAYWLNHFSCALNEELQNVGEGGDFGDIFPSVNRSGQPDRSQLPGHMTPRIRFHTDADFLQRQAEEKAAAAAKQRAKEEEEEKRMGELVAGIAL